MNYMVNTIRDIIALEYRRYTNNITTVGCFIPVLELRILTCILLKLDLPMYNLIQPAV